jgi:hypothetical protein
LKEKGASKRAVTHRKRCSLDKLSAERCLEGPRRSCRGEGKRQQGRLEPLLDLSGVCAMARLERRIAEQEKPYLAAGSGKDRAYKAGRRKAGGGGREFEGFIVPMKACRTTRWREGTLL